ncbi:acetyltransferase [Photobacterium iliopiscarium]|jgi:GNAT superfamily N-acetyltransferase|uniref:N-acetyltransferase n=1 Tax=Photobacterium iliopiscarium TaxID=56192 RepID=A0A0D8PRL6_9GAMM|nr:GNAT family N-acetyltransferase [Photobacterium iliopiscarium]KJG21586.1 acetyltransferase [Photobacterium iliopiscarium]MCD9466430.1 N-acetyltransferase [Photobacterium iliopiscarium]MCD9486204.1 GNAT family N-acetyltransferase [Photobacterium iliopiscarium]MCF2244690.1 GNAT family N-acetyltransferase [Photobacterium iliopiscarium]PST96765.1 N-acetyltransferase [Photobacterium iliopiscarium]
MNISLRTPILSSLDKFLQLIDELFDYEALPQKAEQTMVAVKQLLSNPALGQAWFIEVEQHGIKHIAGHIIVSYSFSLEHGGKIGLIDQFYLKANWRQHGIGTELLPQLETLVVQDGVKALSLEVNIGNAGARNFYEKHGFTPRRQFCMMTKNLTESPVAATIAS